MTPSPIFTIPEKLPHASSPKLVLYRQKRKLSMPFSNIMQFNFKGVPQGARDVASERKRSSRTRPFNRASAAGRGCPNKNPRRAAILPLATTLVLAAGCADAVDSPVDLEEERANAFQFSQLTQAPAYDQPAPGIPKIPFQIADSPTDQGSTHSPIIVDLEVDGQPRLHEFITIRLNVRSAFDATNTTAAIVLPEGVIKVDGSLEWQGDLERHKPIELLARIKFVKSGKLEISGYAKHVIDEETSWGDVDYVYLNVIRD